MIRFTLALLFLGSAFAQWDANFQSGRAGIVHLFEWHWDTIADECETFLGPNGYAGVQISPPNENRVIENRPWWERYQPISYILNTRSGDRAALSDMVSRCRAAGVEVYADVVINHMCGTGGTGVGTAGSYFDANTEDFPAVPFTSADMNDGNCQTSSGMLEDMQDENQVRNCQLYGLIDLNQGKDSVRDTLVAYLNDLVSLGISGFRVDASKHMWPQDLEAIFGAVNDLESGKRPLFYQEVIDQGGEPVKAEHYVGTGRVTEFNYGLKLAENKDSIHNLENFGESWGLIPSESALAFLSNHDNQRGHGGAGEVITFQDPSNLKIFNAFMMAWPYGVKRIMSSYNYDTSDDGPPEQQRSVNSDGSCGNNWVCEHRWPQIKNMIAFATAAEDKNVENWWTNSNNQIAFSRGNKAFLAINKAGYDMNEYLQTGLPKGSYCDVISGDVTSSGCTGQCVSVDSNGYASVSIKDGSDPMMALHVNAMCSGGGSSGGGSSGGGSSGGNTGGGSSGGSECTSCSSCSAKVDCGYMGIDQSGCESQGCLWCPTSRSGDPWCINKTGGSSSGGSSSGSCSVSESAKQECGYMGIDQSGCESKGCCWAESSTNGVPWCYNKA